MFVHASSAAGSQRLRDGVGRSRTNTVKLETRAIRRGSRDECGQETINDDLGDDDDDDEHCTATKTRRGRVGRASMPAELCQG